MDDDMQHDPRHILKMLEKLNDHEVCYVKYIKSISLVNITYSKQLFIFKFPP